METAVDMLRDREREKCSAVEAQLAELRVRRESAQAELDSARSKLVEYDDQDNRRATSDAEAVVRAYDHQLADLDHRLEMLRHGDGDPQERQRFAQVLDRMRQEYVAARERNHARATDLGVRLGRQLAEVQRLIREMCDSQHRALDEIRALNAVLAADTLTVDRALGVDHGGMDEFRVLVRRAVLRELADQGVARWEMRHLFDDFS